MKICIQCRRSEEEGAQFGTLAESGQTDKLCVKCRFNSIDAKYSDPESIRREMVQDYDIPVNRRARKLRNL